VPEMNLVWPARHAIRRGFWNAGFLSRFVRHAPRILGKIHPILSFWRNSLSVSWGVVEKIQLLRASVQFKRAGGNRK